MGGVWYYSTEQDTTTCLKGQGHLVYQLRRASGTNAPSTDTLLNSSKFVVCSLAQQEDRRELTKYSHISRISPSLTVGA